MSIPRAECYQRPALSLVAGLDPIGMQDYTILPSRRLEPLSGGNR